ncbi:MAG: hypothetical protein PHW69_08150 [Elusimicrobiaceae bacterium]|nr:hypothetical protein [Elusimicrobiaceae bacterium]
MRVLKIAVIMLAGLLAGCGSAGPKSVVKNGSLAPEFLDTSIDKEYLWVRGLGAAGEKYADATQRRIMSREAAIANAQLRATEYLNGAAVNSKTRVENGVTDDQQLLVTVNAAVAHAEVVSAEYTKDDGCAVVVRLKLSEINRGGIIVKPE